MKYSPAHIKDIGSISQETLRHWRKVLPPLAAKKGRNNFSLGDILALLVVKDLCSSLKIKVSEIIPIAEKLFDLCNPIKWESYRDNILVYHPATKQLEIYDGILALNSVVGPAVFININMHIGKVKNYVLGVGTNDQLEIQFAPRLVRRK
jgi:hypothetical protein